MYRTSEPIFGSSLRRIHCATLRAASVCVALHQTMAGFFKLLRFLLPFSLDFLVCAYRLILTNFRPFFSKLSGEGCLYPLRCNCTNAHAIEEVQPESLTRCNCTYTHAIELRRSPRILPRCNCTYAHAIGFECPHSLSSLLLHACASH